MIQPLRRSVDKPHAWGTIPPHFRIEAESIARKHVLYATGHGWTHDQLGELLGLPGRPEHEDLVFAVAYVWYRDLRDVRPPQPR
jgi:hypothetical protein